MQVQVDMKLAEDASAKCAAYMEAQSKVTSRELSVLKAQLKNPGEEPTKALKALAQAKALLQAARVAADSASERVFEATFGVLPGSLVAKRDRNGAESETVVAERMAVRVALDGSVHFTLTGDSLLKTLPNGLPAQTLLQAGPLESFVRMD